MTQPASDLTDDLQFDVAEPAAGPAATRACVGCRRPIVGAYYALGDRLICPACRAQVAGPPPGVPAVRVAKAIGMGIGMGLVGAAVWFAIRRLAQLQIGLVAVAVGFMVGKAVRRGSGNRGGRGYQVLAVGITYACIAANYVPDILEHWSADGVPMNAVAVMDAFVRSLQDPFVRAAANSNPIGLLIIGFALWEAWKLNARRALPITGPHGAGGGPVGVLQ